MVAAGGGDAVSESRDADAGAAGTDAAACC